MNNKKFSFITCVNNEKEYSKCLKYIQELYVPEGYYIEIISIRSASSITKAYNLAIEDTDSKYKIYLHQDTYIQNKRFLYDILNIFNKNIDIGMIGVIGSKDISKSGIWWESDNKCGKVYDSHKGYVDIIDFGKDNYEYEEVSLIDGLIMITQYDIKWREDIFDGWHFYDCSQSLEFIKSGYKVVVPNQEVAWCFHDCSIVNMNRYEEYREKFLNYLNSTTDSVYK